jgi:hypothetical protein
LTDDPLRTAGHWDRVHFAAACANAVLPLFEQAWPDAPSKRRDPLVRAVQLLDDCASSQRVSTVDELTQLVTDVMATAGAAVAPLYPAARDPRTTEPLPRTESRCHVASFSANAVVSATRAVVDGPDHSERHARDAFGFAQDAAEHAEDGATLAKLEAAWLELPVAPRRAWWRFWRDQ